MSTVIPKRLVNYPLFTLSDISTGIYSVTPSILLMFYMTNILGIPISIASIAAFIPKLLDLVVNPLIGRMSDRTRTRIGQRRPYILFAGLTTFPAFYFTWSAPSLDPLYSAAFISFAFSMCTLCYSAYLVPYCALCTQLPATYNDSTSLNSYRATYAMLGVLLAGAGSPWLVEQFGGGSEGYGAMGAIMGLIMAGCIMVTFFFSEEPTASAASTQQGSYVAALKNKPYFILLTTYTLTLAAAATCGAAIAYFCIYSLGRGIEFLSILFLVKYCMSMLCVSLLAKLGKRVGKFSGMIFTLLLAIVGSCGYYFLDAQTPLYVLFPFPIMIGISAGGVQLFVYSMLTDCVQKASSTDSGGNSEAFLVGVFITGERIALALGALLAGGVLALAGLVETSEGMVEQPQTALHGIYWAVSILPAALYALALLTFILYRSYDKKFSS